MKTELYKCTAANYFKVGEESYLHKQYEEAIAMLIDGINSFEIILYTDNKKRLIDHLGLKPLEAKS